MAATVQTQMHDALLNVEQLDVAAVRMEVGPHSLQGLLNTRLQVERM